MLTKILIAGDGGQGVQTIAAILAQALFKAGHQVSLIPNYGLEQRGGMSLAYLQISGSPIIYPRFSKPDYLILMSEQARGRVSQYLSGSQEVIETEKYLNLLKAKNLSSPSYNLLVLGLIAKILIEQKIIEAESVRKEIEEKLGQKKGIGENLKAFDIGLLNSYLA